MKKNVFLAALLIVSIATVGFAQQAKDTKDGVNVFVWNLPLGAQDDDLSTLFVEGYGASSAIIIKDRETGQSKGFGMVVFLDRIAAEKAVAELNGTFFLDRMIVVSFSNKKEVPARKKR